MMQIRKKKLRMMQFGRVETFISRISGDWYAFGLDPSRCRVVSIGDDSPGRGRWEMWYTPEGVRQVACPSRSRQDARRKAKRNGIYMGRI